MYDLHESVKVLKLQKEKIIQTQITLLANAWSGQVELTEEAIAEMKIEVASITGIEITGTSEVSELPETGEFGVVYIIGSSCHIYNNDVWQEVYHLDEEDPFIQSVEVIGITPTNIVFVAPHTDYNNLNMAAQCKVIATNQDTNLITFTAFNDAPDDDIVIDLAIGGEGKLR